jgi:hypothetical protein
MFVSSTTTPGLVGAVTIFSPGRQRAYRKVSCVARCRGESSATEKVSSRSGGKCGVVEITINVELCITSFIYIAERLVDLFYEFQTYYRGSRDYIIIHTAIFNCRSYF